MSKILYIILILLLIPFFSFAQEFGFGFADDSSEGSSSATGSSVLPFTLKIGGEIEAGPLLFFNDFKGEKNSGSFNVLDYFSSTINFGIAGKSADLFLELDLSSASFTELVNDEFSLSHTPQLINEIWIRSYFGRFTIDTGFLKPGWGRMFSPGPLDVTNPLDYSDLTKIADLKAMKIARPMLLVSWNAGDFTKLEAVFIPNFQGHRFAQKTRWVPYEFTSKPLDVAGGILTRAGELYRPHLPDPNYSLVLDGLKQNLVSNIGAAPISLPDTSGINYFQTGLRFTTTAASVDLGAQYFYGNTPRPSVSVDGVDLFLNDLLTGIMGNPLYPADLSLLSTRIEYSRYHQLGVDFASVIAGLNTRAEFAGHITEDLSGSNGAVKNPFLSWALGFDRNILLGVNFNIQCNQNIRLKDNKISSNPAFDSEAGTDITSTRLIVQLSRQFSMDRLELKIVNIWGIEDGDACILPSIAWSINDIRAEISCGFFIGDKKGELGQYRDNSFIRAMIKYSF